MSVRRFLRTLLLTCSIPVLGGVGATWWFSQQEPAGAGYECSAKLTSEDWVDFLRQHPSGTPEFSSDWGGPVETAISFFSKGSVVDEQVRDALARKSGAKNDSPVKIEADEVDKAVIRVRAVGPDPALIQGYLKESVIAYEAWMKKLADAERDRIATLTFLEGPSSPAKVKTPMNEAVVMGSFVGGGIGVLVMVLMAVVGTSRHKQLPVSALA
jgi:hypothetical protein